MLGISISIILGALLSIAGIALTILLCVWVYRDAQSKGMIGILWTAIVLLVPSYIGLIIYLIVRMDNKKVTCSNCNKSVNGSNKFCSNCGVELVPAGEVVEDEAFKQSQKKVLIGFFSTLAAIVILSIFMVTSLIVGSVNLIGDAVEWVTELGKVNWSETLEDTLGDMDVLFDEEEIHISVDDELVVITDKEGNELLRVDGVNGTVDVHLKDFQEILDRYNVEYDESLSEEEIEKYIEQNIEDAIEDSSN